MGTVKAVDPEGQPLDFAIFGGNEAGAFAIDPLDGRIRVVNPGAINFGESKKIDLKVLVRDAGEPQFIADAVVTIRPKVEIFFDNFETGVLRPNYRNATAGVSIGTSVSGDKDLRLIQTGVNPGTQSVILDVDITGRTAIEVAMTRTLLGADVTGSIELSNDGGLTWSVPVRVNRDPLVAAFVPTVAIRDDGVLGVSYFDLRSNTLHVPSLETDYWLAQSADGATWRETRLAGPFDLSIAPNANGLFVGDYMALGVRGGQFVPFFATANDGDLGNRTDVHVAFVDGPGDAPAIAKDGVARRAAQADTYAASAPAPALVVDDALAARIDDAVRAAMQRRVPGWRTPATPVP